MAILAIDTSSSSLSLALLDGDRRFYHTQNVGKSGHSRLLVPEIDKLVRAAGLEPSDIDVVACVVGPGSFTGIRIGVAAATALAFANSAKRIAVTYFELLAYNRGRVRAAVDAGHGNYYVADCEDGKVLSARFVEHAPDGEYVTEACGREALAEVTLKKLSDGETVDVFEPYYMRRSQAEREKDEIR